MNGPVLRATSLYAMQIRSAIRMAFADRTNFALQAIGMFVNNAVLVLLWGAFFAGFGRVGDWQRADVALLMGLSMTIVGTTFVFFGGCRDMAATILRGELDALLTQPTPVLPRLLARESLATAFGDLVGGPLLILAFADVGMSDVPWIALALVAGTGVFVSACVMFASLAFWLAGARSFARDLADFTILFSTYPGSIYQGGVKLVAYTLLPAGFVVMLPLEMVRAPSVASLASVIAGVVGYSALALFCFDRGLARYRRGISPQG